MRKWTILILSVCVPGIALGEVQLSFFRSTARITTGSAAGYAELILQATSDLATIVALQNVTPTLSDPDITKGEPEVKFGAPEPLRTAEPERLLWRIPVSLTGMPASPITRSWQAIVRLGTVSEALRFFISNAAAPALILSTSALPSEWAISDYPCQRFRISATGARATGLGLTSTLVEDSTKYPLSQALFLSLDGKKPASPTELERAVNDTGEVLHLCVSSALERPGKFIGSVNISAAEKPEGQNITVTLHHRTSLTIAGGVLVLFTGCILALVFRFIVPTAISQSQAMLPAALLAERVLEMQEILKKRPVDRQAIPRTTDALQESLSRLSKQTLIAQNFIPGFFFSTRQPDTAGYTARLAAESARIQVLQVVVREGILAADSLPDSVSNKEAVRRIDEISIADPVLTAAQARNQIIEILRTIPRLAEAADLFRSDRPLTTDQLILRVEAGGAATLLVWMLISFFTGLFVLILNKPSFGVPMDYVNCFLWAFGIAVGGSLTQNQATTALGIKLPERL